MLSPMTIGTVQTVRPTVRSGSRSFERGRGPVSCSTCSVQGVCLPSGLLGEDLIQFAKLRLTSAGYREAPFCIAVMTRSIRCSPCAVARSRPSPYRERARTR